MIRPQRENERKRDRHREIERERGLHDVGEGVDHDVGAVDPRPVQPLEQLPVFDAATQNNRIINYYYFLVSVSFHGPAAASAAGSIRHRHTK